MNGLLGVKKETSKSEVSGLKHSSEKIGRLYPVLLDKGGNIIDGKHRLVADADWPTIRLEHIASEKDRLLAKLVSNVCRRTVSSGEKRQILESLGKIYIEEGERLGRLAYRIAEETGMTYRWVMKYLPEHMKSRPGLGGPAHRFEFDKRQEKIGICQVERHSTRDFTSFLSDSQQRVVVLKTYVNANFVNLTVEKKFYQRFEKLASKLGIAPETMINNTMVMALKAVERIANAKDHVLVKEVLL